MIENQAQTKPQFILWVKEAGVFRPAEVKLPETHDWYDATHDLMRNVQLGTQDISPDTLNLVSSVYLGPINIFEEQSGTITSKDAFQRLREYKHGTVYGIVKLAEAVAKEQDVPYFGVNIVQTGKDRTWKFIERDDFLRDKNLERKYFFDDKLDKPKKPLEFVLHPTAQLYVPRK